MFSKSEQAPECNAHARLLVDDAGVFLEDPVIVRPAGLLELVDRIRAQEMFFPVHSIVVGPSHVEEPGRGSVVREGPSVPEGSDD